MNADIEPTIELLLAHPEHVRLFRGESLSNSGGLHFTPDREWARTFGHSVLRGSLGIGARVKRITQTDLEEAARVGIMTDREFYETLFLRGYDALVGYDPMNSAMIDVVVHEKHLARFTAEF